jgi:hypothetical protein
MSPGLRRVDEDIWTVDGPPVRAFFVQLPTRMVVVKLQDGSLWINSPVALSHDTLEAVLALGPVRYLVAPTILHTWRLEEWHRLFPQAQLWGPPETKRGLAGTVVAGAAQVPRGLTRDAFTGSLEQTPPPAWSEDIQQLVFKGNGLVEEAEFLHKHSRTLMLTDFVQNYTPGNHVAGNIIKRAAGVLGGGVPRDVRWSFTNRKQARASLEQILSWDFTRVILAHGACIEHDAKPFVAEAFRWLKV